MKTTYAITYYAFIMTAVRNYENSAYVNHVELQSPYCLDSLNVFEIIVMSSTEADLKMRIKIFLYRLYRPIWKHGFVSTHK